MDKMRDQFVAEIERLQDACKRTRSKHLIADYQKAIRRMKMELREYDNYRKG